MPLPAPAQDAVGVVALVALLVTAHRHPRPRTEAVVSMLAAAVALLAGPLDAGRAWDAIRPLLPVVGFLVAILVVAEVCARAGVFTAAARVVARLSLRAHADGDEVTPRPQLLLLGVLVVAVLVTTLLSLDATVVLLTPVVLTATGGLGLSPRPAAYACLRMANSGSLLLPVANLTNLLAMPHLPFGFGGFAARMAVPLAVTLLVEYAGLRLLFRAELRVPAAERAESAATSAAPALPSAPRMRSLLVPIVTVALMLTAFAVLSPVGVEPCWPAAVAAVVLLAWGRRRRLLAVRDAVHAAHPSFVLFVLALGLVVAALAGGFLGEVAQALLPGGTGFADLLLIALVATVAAALLTNLSATLLLVPLLASHGATAVLAALLGLGIGAGLTWTGSLANLLWRRTLVRQGVRPAQLSFHRVSLTLTPVSLVVATAALALVT
ncbi:SLC13 family permease [Nocardioides sp. DS6]|uniref:SLC13 family permease n=1 Tax=Nocardioides eburneus TaxID=3231482 RepID=A0ABV3SXI2_9ACTN